MRFKELEDVWKTTTKSRACLTFQEMQSIFGRQFIQITWSGIGLSSGANSLLNTQKKPKSMGWWGEVNALGAWNYTRYRFLGSLPRKDLFVIRLRPFIWASLIGFKSNSMLKKHRSSLQKSSLKRKVWRGWYISFRPLAKEYRKTGKQAVTGALARAWPQPAQ